MLPLPEVHHHTVLKVKDVPVYIASEFVEETHLKLRSVTCHMRSHSVTCHLAQVNTTHLNPSQVG